MLISKEPTVAGKVAAHVAGLEDEVNVLKRLDHPNIVRYLVSENACLTTCCARSDIRSALHIDINRLRLAKD